MEYEGNGNDSTLCTWHGGLSCKCLNGRDKFVKFCLWESGYRVENTLSPTRQFKHFSTRSNIAVVLYFWSALTFTQTDPVKVSFLKFSLYFNVFFSFFFWLVYIFSIVLKQLFQIMCKIDSPMLYMGKCFRLCLS